MNNQLKIILCLLVATFLAACDMDPTTHFKEVQHNGHLYLLNTWDGTVFEVKNGVRYPLHEVASRPAGTQNNLLELKRGIGAANVVTINAKAKRFGNDVLVQGTLTPFMPALVEAVGKAPKTRMITLHFNDADGFRLGSQTIAFGQLRLLSGGPNRRLGWSFALNGSIDAERYAQATAISVSWAGLIDPVVVKFLNSDPGKTWRQRQAKRKAAISANKTKGT